MTIVVTGIGYLTGANCTPAEILSGSRSARTPTTINDLPVHQVENDRASTGVPRALLRKMDRISQITTTAVGMALMDGQLLNETNPKARPVVLDGNETGLMLDTGFGSAGAVSQILAGIFSPEPEISPLRFPNVVANASSGQAAIAFGLRGPSSTLGGLGSLLYAYDMLTAGRAKRLVVGGTDELTSIYAQALTQAGINTVIPACGDGAAFLILEDADTAATRGAPASAEVVAVEMSSDLGFRLEGATAFAGDGLDRAAAAVLDAAPGMIDWFIGSGWPGTPLREREEALVDRQGIRRALWPKDITGEMFAASNALNSLLATVVAKETKCVGDEPASILVTGHDFTRGQSSAALFRSIADHKFDTSTGATS